MSLLQRLPRHLLTFKGSRCLVDGEQVGTVTRPVHGGKWLATRLDGSRLGLFGSDRAACRALGEAAGLIAKYDYTR